MEKINKIRDSFRFKNEIKQKIIAFHEEFRKFFFDVEEEANLAAFLAKVQGACKNDSSVPGFVGAQVA